MDDKTSGPIVPAESNMKEFTPRAVLLGVLMAVFMGAANAYLGLKAGMTIAATYTTAVIGMAVIKGLKGTLLEENTARTVGSIGGNVATGAIFTLPAFFIAGIWLPVLEIRALPDRHGDPDPGGGPRDHVRHRHPARPDRRQGSPVPRIHRRLGDSQGRPEGRRRHRSSPGRSWAWEPFTRS